MYLKPFRFWCQKVLPTVYDDSISYYETLCKMVAKMNEWIQWGNLVQTDIQELQEAVNQLQKWVDDYDTSYVEQLVEEFIATMIFVEINNDGYIVYNIPEKWEDITFNTTQLDTLVGSDYEYGRLVLSY